ncbi:MAG: DUF3592 domain-containing protein [Acidobacteria bacterium]|nr:DUF3592 domain-containing protein [Acidobacteriota bacterium]
MLFGMPFAAVGTFMLWLTIVTLADWRSAHSWPERQATLEAVNLEVHSGSDSTTYSVTASYVYQYEGTSYTSDQVGLSSGSDNIGDYHQRVYDRLKSAYDRGEQVPCYVNPKNPSEAYLDLELRWGMILFFLVFVITFGGVGYGLIGFFGFQLVKQIKASSIFAAASSLAGAKRDPNPAKAEQVARRDPTRKPVKFINAFSPNPKHHPQVYTTHGSKKVILRVVMAVFWNLISLPVTLIIWPRLGEMDLVSSLLLLLPVIGALMAVGAVLDIVHWRRFGISTLSLKEPPASGTTWECTLTNNAALKFDNGFDITLKPHKSGGNADSQIEIHVHPQRGDSVYLLFQLPVPQSDHNRWTLLATADIPGLDFRAEFDIKA